MEGRLPRLRALVREYFGRLQKTWTAFWSEEWYFALNKVQTVTVILLVMLLAGGSGILFLKRWPGKTVIKEIVTAPSADRSQEKQQRPVKSVIVHVCGAVNDPGVYELPAEKRVNEAIVQAGGGTAEADLNALNLAARLTDGQYIYVPKAGEALPVIGPAGPGSPGSGLPVNLNTATLEQLDSLPGIGEVLARRILEYRQAHGGFKKVSELQDIEGIGEKKYDQLKDKVSVE